MNYKKQPLKTAFNIRIDPNLHLKLLDRKRNTHLTFNKQIEQALTLYFDCISISENILKKTQKLIKNNKNLLDIS